MSKFATQQSAPGTGQPWKSGILLAQALLVLVLMGMRVTHSFLDEDAERFVFPLCVLLVALSCWSLWSWWVLSRSLFDFYSLFLIAVALFNGGHAFLEVLGLGEDGLLQGEFGWGLTAETLLIVVLGLAGLHLGALAAAARASSPPARDAIARAPLFGAHQTFLSSRLVGGALLLMAVPFSVLLFQEAIQVVLASGYLGLFQQQSQTGLGAGPRVLAMFLIPGAFFLLAGAKDSRLTVALAVMIIVSYSSIQFFLGSRHHAAMPAMALVWYWHRRIRPLNKGLLVAGAVGMLFLVFPLVKAARATSGEQRLSAGLLMESFVSVDNPVIATLQELGGSMATVAHTIDLVPYQHGYEMGMGYVYAGLTVVPNLFWEIHPTVARETPTEWLVWTVDPHTASQGGSIGYSCIAEAYLNFGLVGVPVCLGLFGFCYATFVLWSNQPNRPDRLALAACAACFVTFYARAEAADLVRGVVWYSLIPYVAVTWLSRVEASWSFRRRMPCGPVVSTGHRP